MTKMANILKDWEHNEKKAQKFKCRCFTCCEEILALRKEMERENR